MKRDELVAYLDEYLNIAQIKDSSRNGLQVEGSENVSKIGLAVDACMAAYELAVERECQMVIAHHGIIWDGIQAVTGAVARQLKFLLNTGVSLYGAHLPLDLHPEIGNNIRIARTLGIKEPVEFGDYHGTKIGFSGKLPAKASTAEIASVLEDASGGKSTLLEFGSVENSSVAIISGGGASGLNEAIQNGIDCFITGETSHTAYHFAKEAHINVVFYGHYHSEKCGVTALGEHVEKKFDLQTEFLDIPTPF